MSVHDAAPHGQGRAYLRESIGRNSPARQADDKPSEKVLRVVAQCLVRVFAMERHRPLGEFFDEGIS